MTITRAYATALADQLAAACADAEHTLTAAARAPGYQISREHPHPWLAAHADRLRLALTYGTATLCPHIGPAPRVVHAAIWAPCRLACPTCIHTLTPSPAENHTCDRCRRPAARLHAAIAAYGPILLGYGLCPPCHTHITRTPAPRPRTRKDRRP